MKPYAFDTEDDGNGNFIQGGVYDGDRFAFFDTREGMGSWIARTRGRFYTFNLEYDLVNLFWPDLAPVSYWRSNGRILSGRVGAASLFDLVWGMGGVGMAFCAGLLGRKKGALDARSREYLQGDLENTWAVLERLSLELSETGAGKPSGTLAGASLRAFKSMGGFVAPLPAALEPYARGAYYGGRTECFDFRERVVSGFDVNSMFPAAMLDGDFPAGRWSATRSVGAADVVCATVLVPPQHVPPLPLRRERLIFPTGRFRGTWTGEELRHAVGSCGVVVLKLHHAWAAGARVRPFDIFCATLFERRKRDAFSNYYGKRLMNSLYGKLAQQGALEFVSGTMDALTTKLLTLPPRDYNPMWPALITARARVSLHKLLDTAGAGLVYCDTDSIFAAHPHARKFKTGAGLGELKLEHGRATMTVLAPKLYRLVEGGVAHYRSRGVAGFASEEFFALTGYRGPSEQFFETGSTRYRRPTRLYEAVRRKMRPNVWNEITKSFGADGFEKRERLGDGRTRALVVLE